jgi:drug/metabolite transporter (DMT)-like permease
VISSLFGILFWAEHLSASEWLAIGLIMIGGVLSTYSAQHAEPIVAENADH